MPFVDSKGVQLYYEEAGKGDPIVFVHEFGGDIRAWEPQLSFFGRSYRCIAFNARGYPPSVFALLARLLELEGDRSTRDRLCQLAAERFPEDARLVAICA